MKQEQIAVADSFIEANTDKKCSDNEFIQFLEARRWSVKDAQKMIDNWWQWKIKTNIDNLEPEDFPHINDLKVKLNNNFLLE